MLGILKEIIMKKTKMMIQIHMILKILMGRQDLQAVLDPMALQQKRNRGGYRSLKLETCQGLPSRFCLGWTKRRSSAQYA